MDQTIITIGGYSMSHLEFWGTVLFLWSVWLVGHGNIWTWPIGNVAVVLYAVLFWQIRFYADLAEQGYLFVAGFYGWWAWYRTGRGAGAGADATRAWRKPRSSSSRSPFGLLTGPAGDSKE